MDKKILIIEDDENISRLERDYLQANGFTVTCAANGNVGMTLALKGDWDLLLLDVMLPEIDGMAICKKIRKVSDRPILMVSAKREEMDRIKGLIIGADDYIVKPFSPSELVARVVAHINRYERLTGNADADDQANLEIGALKIDKTAGRVFLNGKEVILTNKEFEILICLAEKPDKIFNKEELYERIWHSEAIGETSTVTVHVNRLREKLFAADRNLEYVNTVWGKGYRFYK